MLAFLFSDSHGHSAVMDTICKKNPPDVIIHLGDCVSDCVSLAAYAPLISLRGNNDLFDRVPDETVLDWEGVRLFACHGHRYGVKGGLDRLCRAAKDRNASVALFGHTHLPCNRFMDGVLLCNPGSVGYAGRERESYGELRLAAGQAEFRLRYVQGEAKRSDYSPGLHL